MIATLTVSNVQRTNFYSKFTRESTSYRPIGLQSALTLKFGVFANCIVSVKSTHIKY